MKFSKTVLGRKCPPAVLKAGRYLLRGSERQRLAREVGIKHQQDMLIKDQFDPHNPNLIVYIVDGADWITGREKLSGGVMAIASYYEETKKLPELASYQVIMLILDSTPLLLRHLEFENNITVFRFSQIFSHFDNLRHLIIHIPELLVPEMPSQLRKVRPAKLKSIKNLHLNIMNQNIQKMPGPAVVEPLRKFSHNITMTTAHSRYCTEEMARSYRVPTHHLSNFCGPELYRRRKFEEKSDLVVASNDEHPMKEAILGELQRKLPKLTIQIIQNMTYAQAKAANERAKWGVTFGEGMDLYFLEAVFSGGIGFAVYNDEFFPKDCKTLPTVFESYEEMMRELPGMVEKLNEPKAFYECHNLLFNLLKKHNRYEEYVQRVHAFYKGNYDIPFKNGR